jgi:fumarate reductase subunit C
MKSDELVSPGMVPAADRKSAWPARLDLAQGVSGLFLALFVAFHLLLESSILISLDAMYRVTKTFEGLYLFDQPHPIIVSVMALGVFAVFVLHATLALRKFPNGYRQYQAFKRHRRRLRHTETGLWMVQVHTGFALFFLGSAHLLFMLVNPSAIGPYASADRVWGGMWPLYLLLLIAVVAHAGIGIFRLAVKWNGFWKPDGAGPSRSAWLHVTHGVIGGFLLLGLVVLGAYMKVGYEHRELAGERYIPLATVVAGPSGTSP